MKITYSRDVDVLTIELASDKSISHAEQVNDTILHLSPDDEPVLIEILNAREFVTTLVTAVMQPQPTP